MIRLENVTKQFDDLVILENLSMSIAQGERVAIIGASGCGKSTLLRVLIGLHPVEKGHVYINKKNIHRLKRSELSDIRMKFGLLFQSGALFDSMTVAENIAFPLFENTTMSKSSIEDRVRETLEMVEMTGTELMMPSDLSGGQRKRIGLARALVHKPKIMLYDEPTTGLDPVLSTNIEDLIVKLSKQLNITSVIVTHQISTILRTADKIYLMHNKSLLEPSTPDTIYNDERKEYRHFIRGGIDV